MKEDILEGFKIGADDYITKPFSMEELTFRIEAILRRVRGKRNKESNIYKIGRFYFRYSENKFLAIDGKQTKTDYEKNPNYWACFVLMLMRFCSVISH